MPAGLAILGEQGSWRLAPHLELLDRKLRQLVLTDDFHKLAIFCPPRHGKSTLASKYFPAWYLGNWPDKNIILTSFESATASIWGREVKDLTARLGPQVFGVTPYTKLGGISDWLIDGRKGGMRSTGIGGAITGRGANLFIIDDPVKDHEKANSPRYRDRAWQWWQSTARSRLEPGGKIVLIQTRWHDLDLAGMILKNSKGWEVFDFPAIATHEDEIGRKPGDALWPERYSVADLETLREDVGDYWFDSLYQQDPHSRGGTIFKETCFRYFEDLGHGVWNILGQDYDGMAQRSGDRKVYRRDCEIFGIVDLAIGESETASYTCLMTCARNQRTGDLLILDVWKERLDAYKTFEQIEKRSRLWGWEWVGIEKMGYQEVTIQVARRSLPIPVIGLPPKGNKQARAETATIKLEGGQVFFPVDATWIKGFESELIAFPTGSNDDQVDCLTYAINNSQKAVEAALPRSNSGPPSTGVPRRARF